MRISVCLASVMLLLTGIVSGQRSDKETKNESNHDLIKVMSFNIRYGTASDGINKWNNRKEHVFEVIEKYQPDIIGMQEKQTKAILYLKGNTQLDGRLTPVKMVDSYRLLYPYSKEVGTFNGFSGIKTGEKIDYIFCDESLKIISSEIIHYNFENRWPSDHFPLITSIILN